jgi:SsrA-binding protein
MKSVYNKRARYDFELLDKFEAGIILLGTEVKSVKAGNLSLKGSFVTIHDEEVYLTNAMIPPWQVKNAPSDYDSTRPRKLLLKKAEVKQLIGAKQAKGLTIVPVRVYTKGPKVKVAIALAKGKRQVDKKKEKKERDIKRDVERMLTGKE